MSGMSSPTGYRETAHRFACQSEQLIGVVAHPAAAAPHDLGVLIVVGGPQYRAGSHRHFVQLARSTAEAGYPVMRFDCRGMGDSTGQPPGFEHQAADIAAAIAAFQAAAPSVRRVVLWGLCDGASASLLYLDERGPDPRVAGLCLLNPWVRSAQSLARVHVRHYYRQRVMSPSFWLKLLRGGVALKAVTRLVDNLRTASGRKVVDHRGAETPFQDRMASAWRGFHGPVLLVLSGNDLTAREFIEYAAASPSWAGLSDRASVTRLELDDADHTFSGTGQKAALQQHMSEWWPQEAVRQ